MSRVPTRLGLFASLAVATLVATYLTSCASAPYTGRTQVLLTNAGEESSMGATLYEQTLTEGRVVQGAQADRVRRIGAQLARHSDNPEWNWEFNLLDSEEPNAFCLPGGKVAVYTGLLPVLDNDDQLAAVMGHEIAHAILRHSGERMSMSGIVDAGAGAMAVMTGGTPDSVARLKTVYGVIGQGGILLPYSREHESEADYVGMIFMARAGYNPSEAATLWENMGKLGGSRPPEWFSTHPSSTTRIKNIRSHLPEVMPIYEAARRK